MNVKLCLPFQLPRGFLIFAHIALIFFFYILCRWLWRLYPFYLPRKIISNLLNYMVSENRFCIINLIEGIVKISSLNKKDGKVTMCVTAEQGPQQCETQTKRPFCPLLLGLKIKLPCAKQIHVFSFLANTIVFPHALFHYFYDV